MESNIDKCPGYTDPTNIIPSKNDYIITETQKTTEIKESSATKKTINELLFPKTNMAPPDHSITNSSKETPINEALPPTTKKERLLLELGLNKQRLVYQDAQLELLKIFLEKYAFLTEDTPVTPIKEAEINAFLKLNDPETGPLSDIHFVKLCLKNNK